MTRWRWQKGVDDDGHPFWHGRGPHGAAATIWRAGGETGEYVTEYPSGGHYPTLAAAKAATLDQWRD